MENTDSIFTLKQNILPQHVGEISVTRVQENHLSSETLKQFLSSVCDGMIGLAPTYGKKQRLSSIAFASRDRVLNVELLNCRSTTQQRKVLQATILLNDSYKKYAFYMDTLATSLFYDCSLPINGAIDILSGSRESRHLLKAVIEVLGGESKVNRKSVRQLFRQEESSKADRITVATQAWAAYQSASTQPPFMVPNTIDTTLFSIEKLDFLAKTIRDNSRLKHLKPLFAKNEIEDRFEWNGNTVDVRSTRYKTRIMPPGSNQVLKVEMVRSDGRKSNFNTRVPRIRGRTAQLDTSGASQAQKLSICTIGREDPTAAEALRANILLKALQNIDMILDLPLVQDIWFPKPMCNFQATISQDLVPITFDRCRLNDSQKAAVHAIFSNEPSDRIVLIQGPPGTGKTTVIAATVLCLVRSPRPGDNIWLIAQSNVAVKNIAEKLAASAFLDFKILVSKDFHFDWHEHLYTAIHDNVIRSDDFVCTLVEAERLLKGSRVILCTLSMLSNDRISSFSRIVPPNLFIFDEASQIEVGDYIPMLHRYQKTVRKLVFIGDDKQLPPYGQNDVKSLQSVFELPHLRKRALLLDRQYRMPVPIGSIISRHVYDNRLKTVHKITAKTCCRFVDVKNGEEEHCGKSWVNKEQARVVVALAKKLQVLGCSGWRIITPYDAQRSLIENNLKAEGVVWEDKVFNVDSFQGNEDDYIIISIVRTDRIGFLQEQRRVNVMLTRCKKGMIICTNRAFINGAASKSLVALLARAFGNDAWVPWKSVLQPNYRPFPTL